ncbi:hypothetical protein ACFL26_02140 [Patescibacteria group bacterium]
MVAAKNRSLARSVRTHIRRQKSKIRRKTIDPQERERRIAELYARYRSGDSK